MNNEYLFPWIVWNQACLQISGHIVKAEIWFKLMALPAVARFYYCLDFCCLLVSQLVLLHRVFVCFDLSKLKVWYLWQAPSVSATPGDFSKLFHKCNKLAKGGESESRRFVVESSFILPFFSWDSPDPLLLLLLTHLLISSPASPDTPDSPSDFFTRFTWFTWYAWPSPWNSGWTRSAAASNRVASLGSRGGKWVGGK